MDRAQKDIQGFSKLNEVELLEIEGGNSIVDCVKEFIKRIDKGNSQSEKDHPIKRG